MSIEQQISQGIMAAMKAKEPVRLATLRNVKKYILEAKTAGVNLDELPDADTLKIIQKLAKQGTESAEIYQQQGREDLAAEERAQVEVLREFLPRELSDDALADALRGIITEVGATGPQDMGRVMGIASKRLAGQAAGGRISAKVKELLLQL
jgi:uncharacterized protein YqeY